MSEVLSALHHHAATGPDIIALVEGPHTIGYATLLRRLSALAKRLETFPTTLGLLAPNGADWVIADLACIAAGKTMVPLPEFFSQGQLDHLIADAGIQTVLTTAELQDKASPLGLPVHILCTEEEASGMPERSAQARRIIYTSGTTGQPKGVLHGQRQLDFSICALVQAIHGRKDDVHLSVLPFPLLLEQICGIHVPLLVGARTVIARSVAAACGRGALGPLAESFLQVQPSTSVLVPQQLAGLCGQLHSAGLRAPDNLRFVAVGGAPLSAALAQQAWGLGLPVYEGYGLSECCSVVAVNRPGSPISGTVGQPLPGVTITIEAGEILVASPGLMQGYTNGPQLGPSIWRTGDVGHIDGQGNLVVLGRRDDVLVTSYGRNIHPAWIEAMVLADPRFARCVALGHGAPKLVLAVGFTSFGAAWFAVAGKHGLDRLLAELTAAAPSYAQSGGAMLLTADQCHDPTLFTANGRPRRAAFADQFSDIVPTILAETTFGAVL